MNERKKKERKKETMNERTLNEWSNKKSFYNPLSAMK